MLEGSCHCGAVRWQFDGVPDFTLACSCHVVLDRKITLSFSTPNSYFLSVFVNIYP